MAIAQYALYHKQGTQCDGHLYILTAHIQHTSWSGNGQLFTAPLAAVAAAKRNARRPAFFRATSRSCTIHHIQYVSRTTQTSRFNAYACFQILPGTSPMPTNCWRLHRAAKLQSLLIPDAAPYPSQLCLDDASSA